MYLTWDQAQFWQLWFILSFALPRPEFYFLSEKNKVRARLACKQTLFYFYFPFFNPPPLPRYAGGPQDPSSARNKIQTAGDLLRENRGSVNRLGRASGCVHSIGRAWSQDKVNLVCRRQMHTPLTGSYMIYSWSEKPFPSSLGVKSDRDWIVPSWYTSTLSAV